MSMKPLSKSGSAVSPSVMSKWTKMIETFQDKAYIKPSKKEAFAQILEEEMKHLPKSLKENVTSTGSFLTSAGASALGTVPFYIGVIRRAFPKLIGMNLMGVQPLSQPGGVIFATQRTYTGTPNKTPAHKDINKFNSRVLVSNVALGVIDDTVNIYANDGAGTTGTQGALIGTGLVVYAEDTKTLVKFTSFSGSNTIAHVIGGTATTGVEFKNNTSNVKGYVSIVLQNFAVFDEIFSNYSMFKDNILGINTDEFDGDSIKEIGNDIITIPVTNIKNRKIKSKVSQEVIEDMQAYKYDVQSDLMNIMLEDITAEMNREFYSALKGSAESTPDVNYTALTGVTDFDKYIQLISKATNLSNKIAVDLKTATGNYMVISPAILSAFTSLSKYWNYSNDPTVGNINLKLGNFATEPLVGKFNNMWDLYIDIFSDQDQIMVGHYSENNLDNAWFWLPYIALTPDILKDPQSGQWILHYRTRYALIENPYGAYRWLKKFNVTNFSI